MNNNNTLGKTGEEITSEKLKQDGFTILHKNYTKQYGEIDIIAQKDDLLVFVEVKMRKNPLFDLAYLITPHKQKKIILVAQEYIARYNHTEKTCQFDVALIQGTKNNHTLTYIPNAFCENIFEEKYY